MFRISIATATIAAATCTAGAAMVRQDLSATGTGSGAFAPLPNLTLLFSAEFDMASSVLAPVVGEWTMTMRSGSETVYTASGTGFDALTYTRFGSTRKYTMVFDNTPPSDWQGLVDSPYKPTLFEIGYVAAKSGTTYGTIGDSLNGSTASGFLMVITNGTPTEFGAITSIGYAIPSPGASALLGMAGLCAARRRRS